MKKLSALSFIFLILSSLAFAQDSDGKSKISYKTWTMIGLQSKFSTQSENDPSKKGLDIDSVSFGAVSYNKFEGRFLPECPVFIELCLAETQLDDTLSPDVQPIYLMQRDKDGNYSVEIEDGLKDFAKNIFSNTVSYSAQSTDNSQSDKKGPGTAPYLGHIKFGINTPFVNFVSGFNYAKPDLRQPVLWKTVDNSWDAGYQHTGGFNQFSLGNGIISLLKEKTGFEFSAGFSPNKSADRKGSLYGHYGWLGMKKDEFVIDFQSNGMYDNGHLFYDSVEQDLVLGAKDSFYIGRGKLSIAGQGLLSLHQKYADNSENSDLTQTADYFGYSTDVFYRTKSFEGIKNLAGQVRAEYSTASFLVNASYRLRGMQASMLYVRENTDDGTFDLSEQLGVLNSQNIDLYGRVYLMNRRLNLSLAAGAKIPLEDLSSDSEFNKTNYWAASGVAGWYPGRCASKMEPLYTQTGGAEFKFIPEAKYEIPNTKITVGAYGIMNLRAYRYDKDENGEEIDSYQENKYASSDSVFRLNKAGANLSIKDINSIVQKLEFFYGLDNANSVRLFNTLVSQVELAGNIKVAAGVGLKTIKSTDAADSYDSDYNNPLAFSVGVAKKLRIANAPTVYAQFVYNMDSFKKFGEGQDNLALDRSNVSERWDKGSAAGTVDAVDYYDGKAAVRAGIRWDI